MACLTFHYHGSFGDLFDIASFLATYHQRHRFNLIASDLYYDLLRVFLGTNFINEYVQFIDTVASESIRNTYMLRKQANTLSPELPISPLLHDYPDIHKVFAARIINRRQAYSSILQSSFLLFPSLPYFLSFEDRKHIEKITALLDFGKKSVLYFPNNNTHHSLPDDAIKYISSALEDQHCQIFFSSSGLTQSETSFYSSLGTIIDTPGHLMPFIQSKFSCVSGVMGGAIGIAIDYTNTCISSIVTPNKHYPAEVKIPLNDDWKSIMGHDFFPHPLSRQIRIVDCVNTPNQSLSIKDFIDQLLLLVS